VRIASSASSSKKEKIMISEMDNPPGRPLTFGEKAVGLNFNPSGDEMVHELKVLYAKAIDMLHEARMACPDPERARLYGVAITEAQGAQMWAVKAATWR
jgi:hypothetical protein